MNITVEGPIDGLGNLLKGIVINDKNPNVTVTGGMIAYPNGRPAQRSAHSALTRPGATRLSVI